MLLRASIAHSLIDLHLRPFHCFSGREWTVVPFVEQTRLLLPQVAFESSNKSIHLVYRFVAEHAFRFLCCKLPSFIVKAIWNPPSRAHLYALRVCRDGEHESITSTWKRMTYEVTRDSFECGISFVETPSVKGRSKNGRGVAIEAPHDGNAYEEDEKRRRFKRIMDVE